MDRVMKIYIITIDEVFDFESFSHKPEAFAKKEDALRRYEDIVEDAKREFAEEEWEESQGAAYYETYPEGYWGTSHYGVYLQEVELK